MADSLPSPPSSRETTPLDSSEFIHKDELILRLDELLEQYLEILDEYTTLREELSKTFSNGFMSLAHAQRTSNMGPGRRYGPDGYDDRMKALKRVQISQQASTNIAKGVLQIPALETNVTPAGFDKRIDVVDFVHDSDMSPGQEKAVQKLIETIDEDASIQGDSTEALPIVKDARKSSKPKIDPAYRDPVTWYGILVPPQLRQAQKGFSLSVESIIPSLLSTTTHLRSMESQIRAIRADLGMAKGDSKNGFPSLAIRSSPPNQSAS